MNLNEIGRELVLDCSGSGYGQVAGTCKGGNDLAVSIKCGEFLN